MTLVLLMLNLIRLAVHQPCICSISDCSRMQSSTEFIARKMLTSSANNKHLECLITLQSSLIIILKSNGSKTHPCGTPERTSKGKEKVSKMRIEDCRLVR
jgi:hypothetical protein